MDDQQLTDITGVILVGGKSRRMGRDKAFLPLDGMPLFERVLAVFRQLFATVVLVGGDEERFGSYGLTTYPDIYPGSALGGLYTGLSHAGTEHIFVGSCDMPFPSASLVRYLCTLREEHDCVVPETEKGFEPLFAVYAKSALPAMLELLQSGNFRIYDLYPLLDTRYVGTGELAPYVEERSLINLNTPEEYRRVIEELEK